MFVLVCPIGGNKDKRTLPDTKIVLSTGKDYPRHLFRTLIGRALLLFREKTGMSIYQTYLKLKSTNRKNSSDKNILFRRFTTKSL